MSLYSATAVASYGYDANGNRLTTVVNGASSSTGSSASSNRLVSTTGASPQSYGYDALGNLTTLGGATAYQYDAFNRMSAAGGMSYYVNRKGSGCARAAGRARPTSRRMPAVRCWRSTATAAGSTTCGWAGA